MEIALLILGFLLILPALAGGLALGLHLFLPQWSEKKRITWSAGLASFLPMALPFAGFLGESPELIADEPQSFVLGLLSLVLATVIGGAVLCLPTAWYATSRLSRPVRREGLPACEEEVPAIAGEPTMPTAAETQATGSGSS